MELQGFKFLCNCLDPVVTDAQQEPKGPEGEREKFSEGLQAIGKLLNISAWVKEPSANASLELRIP